jgi:adenylate cyclase
MLYRFDDYILDTDRFELRKQDKRIRAEPQVISLIVLLIQNKDCVVTKDALIEHIWKGRIVSDAAVSSRIKSARQALGDDGKSQKVILTIHKKGFRFIGDVTKIELSEPGTPASSDILVTTGSPSRKLAVILHADIVGSTDLVQINESVAHQRIPDVFERLSSTVETYGGIAHEIRGDALIAEFARASDAVAAAICFQLENNQLLTDIEDKIKPELRIGIAMDEVFVADHTITGYGVVLAQRLEQLASPGAVIVQGTVSETVPIRLPFEFEALGEHNLEGITRPVRAFVARLKLDASVPAPEIRQIENNDESSLADVSAISNRPSIAVLPFTNMSAQTKQEYLSDGISTDIITHLSKHRWLNVTARNTAFGYKEKSINIQAIGKELKVDYVLDGSVQRSGDRVRITAQLIDAHSGNHTWLERFDRQISDIFELQDEITEKIVARVEPEIGLSERNRVVNARPTNLKAWDCFHLGIYHFFKFTGDDNLEAQRLLNRAIKLDSGFGDAYAWSAYAMILGMVYWDILPTTSLLDQALTAVDKAVSLDSQNATFHALKGRILLARCEYRQAIAENEIAISLNPTFAAAHCGLADSLAYEGNYEEAIERFSRAIALSPNDPQRWAFYTYGALALIFKGDFELALDWTEKARAIPNCQYWTVAHKAVALALLKRDKEAKQTVRELKRQKPGFTLSFAEQKLFYLKDPRQLSSYIDGLKLAGIE